MVLAERNSELVRNGRRSRGPSPNGHGTSSAGGGSSTGVGGGGVGGAGTPENSSDDDNSIKRNGKSKTKQSEYEEKIRVGRDYQAVCPPLVPEVERKPEVLNERALLVWSPTKEIPDTKLDDYISVAKEKYGYNGEQALGMLFWHKHDLERAVLDLANFTPFPDEWTTEDRVLFEQAFQFHGKSFHRIRQMLPDKSIASLVKYYYSWKKTRHRHSVMDRQEKAKANKEGSENGSDNGSNEDSDNDDKNFPNKSFESANDGDLADGERPSSAAGTAAAATPDGHKFLVDQQQQHHRHQHPSTNAPDSNYLAAAGGVGGGVISGVALGRTASGSPGPAAGALGDAAGGGAGSCTNCGVHCNVLNAAPDGKLCASCHHHWRRTGSNRPTSGPYLGKRLNAERHKRKPPRGMYINHDDIVALASGDGNQDKLLREVERDIQALLSQVQLNKQAISALKKQEEDEEDIRPPEVTHRISPRWSNEELSLAIQGIRKYGKDFQTIAELIGTKTEAHVRTFFHSSRRRYNLDQEVKKFEAEREAANVASKAAEAAASTAAASAEAKAAESSGGTATNTTATKKKEASVEKDGTSVVEESDTTTSSSEALTGATKSLNDEGKGPSSGSTASSTAQESEIMEIDLEAEPADPTPIMEPPAKKLALAVPNKELPEPTAV